MSGYDAGEAFVRITPNFDGFVEAMIAKCRESGAASGRAWSEAFNARVRRDTDIPAGPSPERSRVRGTESGGAFANSFKARVEAALRALPPARIGVASTEAEQKIKDLRVELEELSHKRVGVDIDATTARAELRRLQAALAELDKKDADIQVRVDTRAASAELRRFEEEAKRVDQSANFKQAQASGHGLLSTLIPLAPALVPVAGAALAAGGALVAMGVTGALAIKGIQDQIKAGTPLGAQYGGAGAVAKADLGSASSTAAQAMFSGLDQAVTKLNAHLPELNGILAQSGAKIGDIASHLTGALIGGFTQLGPVTDKVLTVVDDLSGRFEAWANGAGGAGFIQTLGDDFDQVLPVLKSLTTLAGHFIASLDAPGGAGLDFIKLFADDLNMIPVPLMEAATTAYIAFRTAVAVTTGIRAATTALEGFATAQTAAAAAATEGAAAGAAGAGAGAAEGALVGRLRGAAGGMAAFITRAIPFVAAYAGITYAVSAASSKFDDFNTTLDVNRARWGATLTGAKDFLTLNWGKLDDDLSAPQRAQDRLNQLRYEQQNVDQLGVNGADALRAANPTSVKVGTGYGTVNVPIKVDMSQVRRDAADAMREIQGIANRYSGAVAQRNTAVFESQIKSVTQLSGANDVLQGYVKNVSTALGVEKSWTKITDDRTVKIGKQKFEQAALDQALKNNNGDYKLAVAALLGHAQAQAADQAALDRAQTAQKRINNAVGEAATHYKLTNQQIDLYASVLGVTAAKLGDGTIRASQFDVAIGQIKRDVDEGGPSMQAWVAAIGQFNQAGDTLASRAALMGQAMVSLQGGALGYANTMVQAATANQQMLTDWGSLKKGVVNLKTGFIDYHNAAAAPVLNDLQQLQTAAMNAATATYQQEAHTLGLKQASKDAAAVFRNDTHGALTDQAKQLGITGKEAGKLADRYFHWPKNAKTLIEQLGGDKVQQTLGGILKDLDQMTGNYHAGLYADDYATGPIDTVTGKLQALTGRTWAVSVSETTTYYNTNKNGSRDKGGTATAVGSAAAFGQPDGKIPANTWFTVGEGADHTWEGGYADAQGRVTIWSNSQAKAMGFQTPRAYAGGTGETGGFTGTTSGSGKSSSGGGGSTAASKAESKAADEAKQKLQAATQALVAFREAVGLVPNPVHQAESAMLSAAKAAGASAKELRGLKSLGDRMSRDYTRLQSVQAKLGMPTAAPTAYDTLSQRQQQLRDLRSSIVDAIKGGFTIATAGQTDSTYSDAVKASIGGSFDLSNVAATATTKTSGAGVSGVSVSTATGGSTVAPADVVSQIQKAKSDADRFVTLLKKLAREGLPQGLLQQLASAGPAALPQAEALAGATPAQLLSIRSAYAGITADSNALTGPGVTFGSIYSQAQKAASDAGKLSRGLRKLAREGLNKDLVAQLAQGGLASLPEVEALLAATPAQLKALNHQEALLGSAAGVAGQQTASAMYQAGIDSAQGIVDGLKSREKTLRAEMSRLGKALTDQVKKDLGIHSPSTVFRGFGQNTVEGFVGGVRQSIPNVNAAMGEMTGAVLSARLANVSPAGKFGGGVGAGAGTQLVQHIHPQPGQSEAEIATMSANKLNFMLASR